MHIIAVGRSRGGLPAGGVWRRSRAFALALLAIPSAAGVSHAQELRVEPRMSIEWEYSDNIYLTTEDAGRRHAGTPEEPVSDSSYVLTPGVSIEAIGQSAGATLDCEVGRVLYQRESELDTWRHDLKFDGFAPIAPKTVLRLRNWFARTEDPLKTGQGIADGDAGQATQTDSGLLSNREPYTTTETTADIGCAPGENTSFGLQCLYGTRREKGGSPDDYVRHLGGGQFARRFSEDWNGAVRGSYDTADFDAGDTSRHWDGSVEARRRLDGETVCFARYRHERVDVTGIASSEPPEPDLRYTVLSPEVGLVCTNKRGGRLSVSAGYFFLLNDDGDDSSGLSGSCDASRSSRRSTISVRAATGHDVRTYARERADSLTFGEVGVRLSYALTELMRLGAQASFRREKYDDAVSPEDGEEEAAETQADEIEYSVRLGYRPRNWMDAQLSYARTDHFSRKLNDDYTENRVWVTLTTRYPWAAGRASSRARR